MRKKIYPYELIGREIEVITSTNPSNLHLQGKVVDETKYTLKVIQGEKTKTLLKNNITFKIKKNNLIIEGKTITKRPEERIKER
ncbi:MAG: ribonuclease P protein subunit [Candidatus Woesearchaeota archaeon]